MEYRFVRFIGSRGEGPGQFDRPMGMAVGPGGELYVADSGNRRIQVLSPEGEFIRELGTATGIELGNPVDVELGPDGGLYVADFDQDRIYHFSSQGDLAGSWGGPGDTEGRFDAPSGVAVGPEGRVGVADFYNHRVQVFQGDGRLVAVLGSGGRGQAEMHYPTDVAFDRQGRILVADAYNHRVLGMSPAGVTLFDWGTRWMTALGLGRFKVPTGVAVDDAGRVHVADSGHKRAVLLDGAGHTLAEWSLPQDAHPEIYSPTRVAVSGRRAYFVDTSNDRIVVLTVEALVEPIALRKTSAMPGGASSPC